MTTLCACITFQFQPTPSLRRATHPVSTLQYHQLFQPTPSLRRTTLYHTKRVRQVCISTHALLAEDDSHGLLTGIQALIISTHALLAEDDVHVSCTSRSPRYFNPRPPCGGRRQAERYRELLAELFQPTPSLRRTTHSQQGRVAGLRDFNPRPPCGGRPTRPERTPR